MVTLCWCGSLKLIEHLTDTASVCVIRLLAPAGQAQRVAVSDTDRQCHGQNPTAAAAAAVLLQVDCKCNAYLLPSTLLCGLLCKQ